MLRPPFFQAGTDALDPDCKSRVPQPLFEPALFPRRPDRQRSGRFEGRANRREARHFARMPSFDVVSKVQWNEIDNALGQASKELAQRFDFQGTGASVVPYFVLMAPISALATRRCSAPLGCTPSSEMSVPKVAVGLENFGITPNSIGDEQVINFNVPTFKFNGQPYTRVGITSNGTEDQPENGRSVTFTPGITESDLANTAPA